jgi:hypothetical protein
MDTNLLSLMKNSIIASQTTPYGITYESQKEN